MPKSNSLNDSLHLTKQLCTCCFNCMATPFNDADETEGITDRAPSFSSLSVSVSVCACVLNNENKEN